MFDFFVNETLWLYDAVSQYSWIFPIFYFASSLASLSIFGYHELQYKDLDYYLANVEHLQHHSVSRYKINKKIFSAVLPLAMVIIVWSLIDLFDSKKFLTRYG